ncbi:MAG: addiction module protein [Ignavibacteriae bacterium]|nr:addiction module protein [Ignavibacteriota bacterium]
MQFCAGFTRCHGDFCKSLTDLPEIVKLSIPEKILLLEDMWENIVSDETSVPVPQSHIEVLEKRMKRYESAPGNLLSLHELRSRIERRKWHTA